MFEGLVGVMSGLGVIGLDATDAQDLRHLGSDTMNE